MPHPFGDDHWCSGFSLVRDLRVLYVEDSGGSRLQHVDLPELGSSRPEVTVIIVAAEYHDVFNPLVSIMNVHYPINAVIVCLDPEHRDEVVWIPWRYAHSMPRFKIFEPKEKLSVCDGMNAGLQSVDTPYVCVLGSGAMLHMLALECLTANVGSCDWIEARRFKLSAMGWAQYSTDLFKPLWKTDCIIRNGGFQGSGDDHEIEESLMARAAPAAAHARLDSVLFFG
jgi:hypothetical protein